MASSPSRPPSADVPANALVRVGYIFRPHGVKGEIKVDPEATDDPERFYDLDRVYVGHDPESVRRHRITSVRLQETKRGITVILRLDGVDGRTAAEAIAKQNLYAHEDDLDLSLDEVFIHDVVGVEVVSEAGNALGTVSGVMQMPGHDVLVVARPDADDALIPAVEAFVVDLDLETRRLTLRPIDGLL